MSGSEISILFSQLSHTETNGRVLLEILNKLVTLIPEVQPDQFPYHLLNTTLYYQLASPSKTLRMASLRVLRSIAALPNSLTPLSSFLNYRAVPYWISSSLERDSQTSSEHVDVSKLILQLCVTSMHAPRISVIHPLLASSFPRPILQSLVALAEYQGPNDNFQKAALAVLCELASVIPTNAVKCSGIRTLCTQGSRLNSVSIQDTISNTLLYLLNSEETRPCISLLDLRLLFSPLTQIYGTIELKEKAATLQAVEASRRMFISFFRSWVGVITMYSDPMGLRSIINALPMQTLDISSLIIDAIFAIFRLTPPKEGDNPFSPRRAVTVEPSDSTSEARLNLPPRTRRHNLLDNFNAAVLIAFVESGLVEALVDLILRIPSMTCIAPESSSPAVHEAPEDPGAAASDDDPSLRQVDQLPAFVTTKSIVLLGEILFISNNLLQPQHCARLQTLANLFSLAVSSSTDPALRSRATSLVSRLHQYMNIKEDTSENFDFHTSLLVSGASKWRRLKGKDKRMDRIENVKLKIDHRMDHDQLRLQMNASNVLSSKDSERWDWEVISDLLEGPFTNPAFVQNGLKTKFFKRLLSFLRPSTGAFANLQRTNNSLKYVRIACQLLQVLLCDSGIDFLTSNPLLPQIAEMLKLETITTSGAGKRIFSAEKVLRTMAREYFTMIGTLSSCQAGLQLLGHHKIFEYLPPLSVMPGREDLSHLIMTSLDYNMPGPSRILLQNSLLSNSKVIRFLATRQLRILLRAGVSEFCIWGVKFLVKQLADTDKNVTSQALSVLDEACDETDCLEALISRYPTSPSLDSMGQAGKDLLVRFLGRSSGYEALLQHSPSFLPDQLAFWRAEGYLLYTREIELALHEGFTKTGRRSPASVRGELPSDIVTMPPHFYGELASTRPGSDVLRSSNHYAEFSSILTDESQPSINRRGALWVIGQVARSETGLQFLINSTILPWIVQYAEVGSNLSLRGTAINCLGLISSTSRGLELLRQHGWTSSTESTSLISIPISGSRFLTADFNSDYGSEISTDAVALSVVPTFPSDDPRTELFRNICNLSNHITAESAFRNLKRIYAETPELFNDPEAYYSTFLIMESYRLKLQARRFIHHLFRKAPLDKSPLAFKPTFPSTPTKS